jgi:YfiR/HmsC-like
VAILSPPACVSRLWLAVAVFAATACWAAAAPSEYQVKAVFLFNFTQFVDWPPEAFPGPDTPFVIGVLGKDPFGSQLDEVVRGETVNRRPLLVERYRSVTEIHNCNILFIGSTEVGHLEEILAALKGRSILTVSDADSAGQRGVMIRLVTESNRIRLRIDVGAAKAGNLTISSKLLRPAEIVGGGEG